jgi:hypothetical protein
MPDQIIKDLRDKCGPVRDQGVRPTCLAFATSDAHAALRLPWRPLSCEFAFYRAQRRAGRAPTSGATLPFMLETLELDGQPVEADWPYLAAVPNNLALWVPPSTVGTRYRRRGRITPSLFEEILDLLDLDRPVIVGMMLSNAFYSPAPDGRIESTEPPDPALRHAVIAVGHGVRDKKRCVLVRNSWGSGWGENGYGWLMETYLVPRLLVLATLTEEPNVPASTLAA